MFLGTSFVFFKIHPHTYPTLIDVIRSVLNGRRMWSSPCPQGAYSLLHNSRANVSSPGSTLQQGLGTSVAGDTREGHVTLTSRGRQVSGKAFREWWHRLSLRGCCREERSPRGREQNTQNHSGVHVDEGLRAGGRSQLPEGLAWEPVSWVGTQLMRRPSVGRGRDEPPSRLLSQRGPSVASRAAACLRWPTGQVWEGGREAGPQSRPCGLWGHRQCRPPVGFCCRHWGKFSQVSRSNYLEHLLVPRIFLPGQRKHSAVTGKALLGSGFPEKARLELTLFFFF